MKLSHFLAISSAISLGFVGCAGNSELDGGSTSGQYIQTPGAQTTPAPAATTPAATTPVATTPVATTPVATTPVATTPVATTPPPASACSGGCWDGTCFDCAIGGEFNDTAPCKATADQCWASTTCVAYRDCKDACAPGYDAACTDPCGVTHAAGKAEWDAILSCAENTAGCTACF